MICGNCKDQHSTVAEVRNCYILANTAQPNPAPVNGYRSFAEPTERPAAQAVSYGNGARPTTYRADNPGGATDKQVAFILKLMGEKVALDGQGRSDEGKSILEVITPALEGNGDSPEQLVRRMTKREASAYIDKLMALPRAGAKSPQADSPAAELEDGCYLVGEQYVLVYHTIHGANQQVAKLLEVTDNGDGTFTGEWVYAGKRGLRGVKAEHKLTEEQAKEFGMAYGFCVFGHPLTAEESKHVGYGRTCASKNGWWYPTKAELRDLNTQAVAAL